MTTIRNPAFEGQTPRLLTPTCHDRSAFLTIRCLTCDGENHIHETQLAAPGVVMMVRCQSCRGYMEFTSDDLRGGFQQMCDDGWIA